MNISFNTICQELQLATNYQNTQDLEKLKKWCYENVSQDIQYEGTPHDIYLAYLKLAEHFLDDFMASHNQNKNPSHAIEMAAQNGYNYYISNSNFPKTAYNYPDSYGMTPLHKAATFGHQHTVDALLKKAADVHAVSTEGWLPIHSALFVPMMYEETIIQQKEIILHTLLPLTPEALSHTTRDENTIFHFLAASPHFHRFLVEILKTHPTHTFKQNVMGCYPIHTAILNQQIKNAKSLLNIEGVSEEHDAKHQIPLHYAARYGSKNMLETTLQKTKNIEHPDAELKTPLYWAAASGNLETLQCLLQHGANPNCRDFAGHTLLHAAIIEQHSKTAQWIIENLKESLINEKDNFHKTPLFYAKETAQKDIVQVLIKHGGQ